MKDFSTKHLPDAPDAIAPDGSNVRILLGLASGGMAHFELPSGETSTAVAHRTVEEIWFFLSGCGKMWRRQGQSEQVVPVYAGICVTIPLGTHFQFRTFGDESLVAIGMTMPPWPGEDEAYVVEGKWEATVPRKFR